MCQNVPCQHHVYFRRFVLARREVGSSQSLLPVCPNEDRLSTAVPFLSQDIAKLKLNHEPNSKIFNLRDQIN